MPLALRRLTGRNNDRRRAFVLCARVLAQRFGERQVLRSACVDNRFV